MKQVGLGCAVVAASMLVSLIAGPAAAMPARYATLNKVTLSGQSVTVLQADDVGADCRPIDLPYVQVIVPPQHGRTFIGRSKVTPHFPATNVHSMCNTTLVDGIYVYYRSNPGFVGTDEFTTLSHQHEATYERVIKVRVVKNVRF